MKSTFIPLLSQYISEKRLTHSIRVADTARQLADHHGFDGTLCEWAGILHDIAKELSPEKCKERHLPISDSVNAIWSPFPLVWHQYAGAEIVAHLYPDTPEAVLDGIRWHTTGTQDMHPISQIIYIADYIEPKRPYPTREHIESLTKTDLDIATSALAALSLQSLISRQIKIFPESLACYNFYLSKNRAKNGKVMGHLSL
jgi:predicted HD superfamily hydrolase involved in NAD metabolism